MTGKIIGMICGAVVVLAGFAMFESPGAGELNTAIEIHYAPSENLEKIDAALIDSAHHQIDLAAYVLTDKKLIEALIRAADRGVAINIYLSGGMTGEEIPSEELKALAPRRKASRSAKSPCTGRSCI